MMTGMTYVLIPGAGGAAWYWHLVEEELRHPPALPRPPMMSLVFAGWRPKRRIDFGLHGCQRITRTTLDLPGALVCP
jgi:hypothetical protein